MTAHLVTANAYLHEMPAPAPGGQVPDWVQLLPAPDARGLIRCRDGRVWFLPEPDALVAAFAANGASLAVDFDHAQDKPELAGDAERLRAAGWIEEVELRGAELWGRVEWTPRAREMLAAREWRYFSPVLSIDTASGQVLKLLGGALVHRPALQMKAVASEQATPAAAPLDATAVALAAALREHAELAAELRRRDAAERVAKAEATGAITPATRGWALALAASDPAAFDEWVAIAAPVFGSLLKPTHTSRQPPGSPALAAARDDPGARIAHALGVDPRRLTGD